MILASTSPRRRSLLEEAGYDFDVLPPLIEEPSGEYFTRSQPVEIAESLAYFKAKSLAESYPDRRILAADTIVATEDDVLGKPEDVEDAKRMLRDISAKPHFVITGVAIIGPGDRRMIASDTTTVRMRPMTDTDIDGYIATGEWEGKAGAYAIQETADQFIEDLDGSFSNVVGLPVELVCDMLDEVEHHDVR